MASSVWTSSGALKPSWLDNELIQDLLNRLWGPLSMQSNEGKTG